MKKLFKTYWLPAAAVVLVGTAFVCFGFTIANIWPIVKHSLSAR